MNNNGRNIIRFTKRGVNSPWHKLVEAMGEAGDRKFNLYLNFNLTRKRLALVSDVCRYKKENKIENMMSMKMDRFPSESIKNG